MTPLTQNQNAILTTSWSLGLGHSVTIRPMRPEDVELEIAFIEQLSPESLYNRLFTGHIELTPERLESLTCIDFARDMALIATVTLGGSETLIGVARYVRLGNTARCEFAIAVADEWQGCGIGTRLMRELIAAAAASGIEALVGEVLSTNTAMLAFMRKLGMSVLSHPNDATVRRVALALDPAPHASTSVEGACV